MAYLGSRLLFWSFRRVVGESGHNLSTEAFGCVTSDHGLAVCFPDQHDLIESRINRSELSPKSLSSRPGHSLGFEAVGGAPGRSDSPRTLAGRRRSERHYQ